MTITLARHQKEAVEQGKNRSLALFHDCGTGKTITALALFKKNRETCPGLRLLVVVSPKVLIHTSWADDIQKFCPEYSYMSFKDFTGIKIPDIFLVNYEYMRMPKTLVRLYHIIRSGDYMCVLDESTHIKNHKSIGWKALQKLAPHFRMRYVMSGTPVPNNMLDLWTQMSFVKPDLLGRSFYKFRKQYGALMRGNQRADITNINIPAVARSYMQLGYKWTVPEDKADMLMQMIRPYTNWVRETDVLDLPNQNFQLWPFELSTNEMKAYRQMYNDMVVELRGGNIAVDTAVAKLMKLRQICGGYMYDEQLLTIGESKIKSLNSLLDSIGSQQAVIWVHFRQDGEQVVNLLKSLKKAYSVIRGGAKDKEEQSRKFVNKETQFMVASPASAGHGLTWVNCHIAVYYSMDYNYETYYQSTKRIHRRGQQERCTYYLMAAVGTIEQKIIKAMQSKEAMQKLIEEITK